MAASLRAGLAEWKEIPQPETEQEFIYPNADGGVIRQDHYGADVLRPALDRIAEETGIEGIVFRACRRTCATHLSKHGGIKDVQAHLRTTARQLRWMFIFGDPRVGSRSR